MNDEDVACLILSQIEDAWGLSLLNIFLSKAAANLAAEKKLKADRLEHTWCILRHKLTHLNGNQSQPQVPASPIAAAGWQPQTDLDH